MARAWVSLILLGLLASQVEAKKPVDPLEVTLIILVVVAATCCCGCILNCCCSAIGIDPGRRRGEKEETRVALTRNPSWERHQWNAQLSTINETKPGSTAEKRVGGREEERVTVQLVDEQLVDLEVPPAELTLTNFPKLLSDLTFYSGQPDLQGLLVKSSSGGFVQVFDLDRIPQGNLKVRTVFSGDKHFLRLYPNPQLEG